MGKNPIRNSVTISGPSSNPNKILQLITQPSTIPVRITKITHPFDLLARCFDQFPHPNRETRSNRFVASCSSPRAEASTIVAPSVSEIRGGVGELAGHVERLDEEAEILGHGTLSEKFSDRLLLDADRACPFVALPVLPPLLHLSTYTHFHIHMGETEIFVTKKRKKEAEREIESHE